MLGPSRFSKTRRPTFLELAQRSAWERDLLTQIDDEIFYRQTEGRNSHLNTDITNDDLHELRTQQLSIIVQLEAELAKIPSRPYHAIRKDIGDLGAELEILTLESLEALESCDEDQSERRSGRRSDSLKEVLELLTALRRELSFARPRRHELSNARQQRPSSRE